MKIKRILGLVLATVMVLALMPVAALAEDVSYQLNESKKLGLLEDAWAVLEAVEAEAMESGASAKEVTMAVYMAALQLELVDESSFTDLDDNGFFFTVDGMLCGYDYKARNVPFTTNLNEEAIEAVFNDTKNGPGALDVLVVGPYYGHDSNFTNQYREEALSLAETTGGERVILQSSGATGPAIAEAVVDAGIVIYDSHGTASGTSSYLCLTTNTGITSQDYSNGWAVNAGGAAYIDGRYIANHINGELPNNLFWMAICEGMKASGRGTTGTALLDAGAGCVYGYSQSVTFVGDYIYEETFWDEMQEGATVAEAFEVMVDTHGVRDPYGDAYPIVMSPMDPFPSNPDSAQTVYCDWTMFGELEPVEIIGGSLSDETVTLYERQTLTVDFMREPENANNYELVWTSADNTIATVAGNKRRAEITGVGEGETTISCNVMVEGSHFATLTANVVVEHMPDLNEATNVEGGTLTFNPGATNAWDSGFSSDGTRACAISGNAGVNSSESSMTLTVNMQAGDSLSFEWMVSSEMNYDKLTFYVNGVSNGSAISGTTDWAERTYTANTAGSYTFKWTYSKDYSVNTGNDCGYVDNVELIRVGSGSDYPIGDVDGDMEVTTSDALNIMRYVLQIMNFTDEQIMLGDINGDGRTDIDDALLAMRLAIG